MCTAVTYHTADHYFGRNLDLEYHFQEAVTITPRCFPFRFRNGVQWQNHYAMIGIATVADGYPLYYDAVNEHGLAIAGLNFPGNAVYSPPADHKDNIAVFELIPWILGQCTTVSEAEQLLQRLNVLDISFSKELPVTPLHWLLADRQRAITIEPLRDGLRIYENPVGVLTNSPPFDFHMHNLANYINLTTTEPINRFSANVKLLPTSRGLGAWGLPGDLSSPSRFIRASFTKLNARSDPSESASISQFFQILGSVAQQRGCVQIGNAYELTLYSSCCNTDKGIYYYTTYENSQITAVDLFCEPLDGSEIIQYPLTFAQKIRWENKAAPI